MAGKPLLFFMTLFGLTIQINPRAVNSTCPHNTTDEISGGGDKTASLEIKHAEVVPRLSLDAILTANTTTVMEAAIKAAVAAAPKKSVLTKARDQLLANKASFGSRDEDTARKIILELAKKKAVKSTIDLARTRLKQRERATGKKLSDEEKNKVIEEIARGCHPADNRYHSAVAEAALIALGSKVYPNTENEMLTKDVGTGEKKKRLRIVYKNGWFVLEPVEEEHVTEHPSVHVHILTRHSPTKKTTQARRQQSKSQHRPQYRERTVERELHVENDAAAHGSEGSVVWFNSPFESTQPIKQQEKGIHIENGTDTIRSKALTL